MNGGKKNQQRVNKEWERRIRLGIRRSCIWKTWTRNTWLGNKSERVRIRKREVGEKIRKAQSLLGEEVAAYRKPQALGWDWQG